MVKVLLFQLFSSQRVLPVKEEPLAICAVGPSMILIAMEKSKCFQTSLIINFYVLEYIDIVLE